MVTFSLEKEDLFLKRVMFFNYGISERPHAPIRQILAGSEAIKRFAVCGSGLYAYSRPVTITTACIISLSVSNAGLRKWPHVALFIDFLERINQTNILMM